MTFQSLRIVRKGLCPHAKYDSEAYGNTALVTFFAIYPCVILSFPILARFEEKNIAHKLC